MTELAKYLLNKNSMSGEYIYHLLRSYQYTKLNENSTLKDLNELLENTPTIDFAKCKEFDDVFFKYGINIDKFTQIWNEYFQMYLNKINDYSIARLISVKLCDNTKGFPMKIYLKEVYHLMDKTTKLIDLYKR